MLKKIIKASAGTGKTYQLSIEYLSLLIQGMNFEEILVITFTRKATAQIRARIFNQLELLIHHLSVEATSEGKVLLESLAPNLPKAQEIDLKKIESLYQKMLMYKQKVKIYTIDSFINNIFSNLIAPFLNISNFGMIDEEQNKEIYERILMIFLDDNRKWSQFKQYISLNPNQKSMMKHTDIIKQILENRWFLESTSIQEQSTQNNLKETKDHFDSILDRLQSEIPEISNVLKTAFQFLTEYNKTRDLKKFDQIMTSNLKLFLGETNFWLSRPLKEIHQTLLGDYQSFIMKLAVYAYHKKIVPFQTQLINLAKLVFNEYDLIKLKDKEFTYQDILYYSYKYLYSEELSFIDHENQTVSNYFYEMLTNKINYILIDEFQDTSLIQWKIILPMINEIISDETRNGGIICVGDEKQAIYGWRGGEQGLLQNLQSILQIEDFMSLQTSYRSSPEIISFVNEFFKKVAEVISDNQYLKWTYPEIEAFRKEDKGFVEVAIDKNERDSEEDTTTAFVNYVQKTIECSKFKLWDVAIIVRRNKEMDEIADLLEERGLKYIIESSASVLDCPAVRDIMYILHYIAIGDIMNLIKILRSNLITINSQELKEILEIYKGLDQEHKHDLSQYQSLKSIRAVQKVLSKIDLDLPIFDQVQSVINYFTVNHIYNTEYDSKNIVKFLELVESYCSTTINSKVDLPGLIQELEKKRNSESYRQVGLSVSDAIQITTIHKAKGLEFPNVFFYWDIGSKARSSNYLQICASYNKNFSNLEDYMFFQSEEVDIIKNIDGFSKLLKYQEEKEFNEEINNIYVALTRAKNRLFLYAVVGKKIQDIDKLKERTGKKTDDMYYLFKEAILSSIKNLPGDNAGQESLEELFDRNYSLGKILLNPENAEKMEEITADQEIYKYLKKGSNAKEIDSKQEDQILYAKEQYIYGQQLGNTVHEYLSYIKYNREDELVAAKKMVYHKYGKAFSSSSLNEILERIDSIIIEHADIFNSRWTVFNEQVIFDGSKEYRIDRLMVDKTKKEVLIIDYKTGEEKDAKQLTTYIKIIRNLPFVKGNDYEINARFVDIKINNDANDMKFRIEP